MFCTSLSRVAAVLTLALSITVFAQEGGEAADTAAPAKKEKKEKPSTAQEYSALETKLNTIKTRLEDAQQDFDRLVWRKEQTKDPKEIESILKEMVEITNQRNKDAEDSERVRKELLYRYPSKLGELNRLYQVEEKKTVEEMTSAADLDDMLTRIKKVIERKFAPFNPESDQKTLTSAPAPEQEPPKKLRLEK